MASGETSPQRITAIELGQRIVDDSIVYCQGSDAALQGVLDELTQTDPDGAHKADLLVAEVVGKYTATAVQLVEKGKTVVNINAAELKAQMILLLKEYLNLPVEARQQRVAQIIESRPPAATPEVE